MMIVAPLLIGFVTGVALAGPTRKGLSMLKPEKGAKIPIPGVPFAAWERFVGIMVVGPKEGVSPTGRLGAFNMGQRQLEDTGLMFMVRKDQTGSYVGKWTPPLTREKFLGNMPLQYAAFKASMKGMALGASGLVGTQVDGKPATLSGLLGVSHAAGRKGMESWLRSPEVRRKFGSTTAAFERTNGIF